MKAVHFLVGILVALAVLAGHAEEVDTLPAQSAARAWLAGVDAGAYAASWDEGAEAFRKAVTREQWEKALAGVRAPMGVAHTRKIRSVTYARSLPGAPEGEYVVIQYETRFAERAAVETVTPMKEKDGTWRVSGYFIR